MSNVQAGFIKLIEQITPEAAPSNSATNNLKLIESCLKTDLNMSHLETFGSVGHGTGIKGYNDIDCLAVIPKTNLSESMEVSLEKLKQILSKQFPSTALTDGRPTIAVPFGTARDEKHQIVPAFSAGKNNNYEFYGVPAPGNQWINISPKAHSDWIGEINENLGDNFKPFIRIIKAWNRYNNSPLWSYYIELCVAEFLGQETSVVYSIDLKNFFRFLKDKNLDPIEGAVGSEGAVYGTSVMAKEAVQQKLKLTAELSAKAYNCEFGGDNVDAYYYWRKLFNWQFPAY